ncbi:hypothetical protein ONS96_014816 [Cadophora gregata f. sp. sojae]|nr:hypothetical protein ONS96_014816 [Cadophora gregata f. sp. sojae]
MRSKILSLLASAVGLAAVVLAAPAISSDTDVCEPVSTVFVTVPQPITITVHDASTNTVGLATSADALPTITVTRHATLHSTLTLPYTNTILLSHPETSKGVQAVVSTPVSYETTVFETAHITVTVHQSGPSSSSVLAFIVENGTTFWLGGHTPVSTKVYVTATSVVTIEPLHTPAGTTHLTSTVTLQSTRYTTRSATQTLTRTLSAFNGTTTQTSSAHIASSFGTAPAPVRTSSSWTGWNATSSAGGVVSPKATDPAKSSKSVITRSFITKESVDIYKTSDYSYTVSTYTAKDGFDVFTTPFTWSANPTSTSMSGGAWTTAVISGQTVSWNAHGVTQTCTESLTRAPYSNTTSSSHHLTSAEPSSTSSIQGVWTTAVIDGQTLSWNGNGITETCKETSTHAPYTNATSTVHHISTSTAAGEVTSSSKPTNIISATTQISSSSSSKWYIYTPASSVGPFSSTGSALGGLTSESSTSTLSSAHFVSVSTATVVPIAASSETPLSSSQAADPSVTSDNTTLLISSTVTPSSHLGVFPTSSSTTFLTLTSSAAIEPSTSLQVSGTTSSTASTTSTALSAASSYPSTCGEVGDFVLNFDDIPPLSISNNSTFGQPQPIFSPYHHFDFSQGFRVGPPPVDPYLPESKPLLAEFIPTADTVTQTRTDAYASTSGYMGNADHGLTTCFSFNFYGASFGCDSSGPDCDFTFTGYRYDPASKSTEPVVSQQLAISACPDLKSLECILTPVNLNPAFENLDSVRIDLTVQGVPNIWWMDDVRLGWFNNTCEKGMCRAKAPAHGFAKPLPVKKI